MLCDVQFMPFDQKTVTDIVKFGFLQKIYQNNFKTKGYVARLVPMTQ
jgi:hypothetical protein